MYRYSGQLANKTLYYHPVISECIIIFINVSEFSYSLSSMVEFEYYALLSINGQVVVLDQMYSPLSLLLL